MFRVVGLSTTLSLSFLGILAGQAAHSVAPGARVRITATWSTLPVLGTVVALESDSLRIHPADPALFPDHPASVAIARSTIRELEVAVKGHSNAKNGALIGLGIGVVGGAVGGAAGCQSEEGVNLAPGGCVVVSAVLFGAIGAGLGALVGSSGRSEHWERVALDQVPN